MNKDKENEAYIWNDENRGGIAKAMQTEAYRQTNNSNGKESKTRARTKRKEGEGMMRLELPECRNAENRKKGGYEYVRECVIR